MCSDQGFQHLRNSQRKVRVVLSNNGSFKMTKLRRELQSMVGALLALFIVITQLDEEGLIPHFARVWEVLIVDNRILLCFCMFFESVVILCQHQMHVLCSLDKKQGHQSPWCCHDMVERVFEVWLQQSTCPSAYCRSLHIIAYWQHQRSFSTYQLHLATCNINNHKQLCNQITQGIMSQLWHSI